MTLSDVRTIVRDILVHDLDIRPERIRDGADICRDLGIDGMDAEVMFEKIIKKFDIDLSNFEFDRYFGADGMSVRDVLLMVYVVLSRILKWILSIFGVNIGESPFETRERFSFEDLCLLVFNKLKSEEAVEPL